MAQKIDQRELIKLALEQLRSRGLGQEHRARFDYELKEIGRQGAFEYWIRLYNDGKRFDSNPNCLILPWLLGMLVGDADVDPVSTRTTPILNSSKSRDVKAYVKVHGSLPVDIIIDADMPDIDIDCLPAARDLIKAKAIELYGNRTDEDQYGAVCSVGTWTSYKFRSAILDVMKALGNNEWEAQAVTKSLPEDVDDLKEDGIATCKGVVKDATTGEESECGTKHNASQCPKCGQTATDTPTLGKLLDEHPLLNTFYTQYKNVVDLAVRLIGRIQSSGMHAGAIIITDRSLYGNVPLALGRNYWVSMWTEGHNTQLSKFGYTKWDFLGLKNLLYIFECCKLIKQNRGYSFGDRLEGWDDVDPRDNRAGHYIDDKGNKVKIELNDAGVLRLANELKTDAVFQFDTDLAKSILRNGVRGFEDLMLFNAMGHPGPMQSIPDVVANRDADNDHWKRRIPEQVLPVLESTHGAIVYQEQLATLWQVLAGFTGPEAQEARKAVAKKWRHKLPPIKDKWVEGATPVIGEKAANEWWQKMETFGRYSFNKCLFKDTVLTCQKTGRTATIEEWATVDNLPWLESYVDGDLVQDECVAIHRNGEMAIFEVEFDDGCVELVTLHHQFMCSDGEYHTVEEIFSRGLEVTRVAPMPCVQAAEI